MITTLSNQFLALIQKLPLSKTYVLNIQLHPSLPPQTS